MSKKEKEARSCPKVRASIGGQALLEGIMMRGPEKTAMAVRAPDGEIVLEKWENQKSKLPKIFKLPIIRGVFNFASSMKIGYKCLMRSAEIALPEEEFEAERLAKEAKKEEKERKKAEKKGIAQNGSVKKPEESTFTEEKIETEQPDITEENAKAEGEKKGKSDFGALMTVIMIVSVILGVGIALLLFIMLPTYIFKWCTYLMPFLVTGNLALDSLIKAVFEGVLKIAVLVGYMSLVTLMKDIKRTFMYHGAEHKTIFCYERGKELTVENVRGERRFHPRCGTSFLILMLLVSIFVAFFIDPLFVIMFDKVPPTLIRSLVKLLLLPITMGIGYELIKIAGKYDNKFTRIISAPGMWLQHITVLEPDDAMIECAIAAFKEVIPEEDKKQASENDSNNG
ncbi:MAG: DUF1385 domain-containing protein [Clostridia bacterium]|nr:DUF1385 domain-containing protein [Clostridia bacterium]